MVDITPFERKYIRWHYGVTLDHDGYHADVRAQFEELFIKEHGMKPPIELPVKSTLLEARMVGRWITIKNSFLQRLITGERYKRIKTYDREERWGYWSRGEISVTVPTTLVADSIEAES